jgi:hypothetical protein
MQPQLEVALSAPIPPVDDDFQSLALNVTSTAA